MPRAPPHRRWPSGPFAALGIGAGFAYAGASCFTGIQRMLLNLLIGIGMMALCLALQISLLARTLIYYARHQADLASAGYLATLGILNGVLALLMFGNLGQVALWALLFQLLGEFDRYGDAFYHSAVNFATLGYGDIVMSEKRRLLGPLQAMNGVLMVGVSTAALMTTLRDAVKLSAGRLTGDRARGDGVRERAEHR